MFVSEGRRFPYLKWVSKKVFAAYRGGIEKKTSTASAISTVFIWHVLSRERIERGHRPYAVLASCTKINEHDAVK